MTPRLHVETFLRPLIDAIPDPDALIDGADGTAGLRLLLEDLHLVGPHARLLGVPTPLQAVLDVAQSLLDDLDDLLDEPEPEPLPIVLQVVGTVTGVITQVQSIGDAGYTADDLLDFGALGNPPLWADAAERLPGYLVARYVQAVSPVLADILQTIGLIRYDDELGLGLDLPLVEQLLTDGEAALAHLFGVDWSPLVAIVRDLIARTGGPVDPPRVRYVDGWPVGIIERPPERGLRPPLFGPDLPVTVELAGAVSDAGPAAEVAVAVGGDLYGLDGLVPGLSLTLPEGSATITFSTAGVDVTGDLVDDVAVGWVAPTSPVLVVGAPDGTNITIESISFLAGARDLVDDPAVRVGGGIAVTVTISAGDGDGFIATLLRNLTVNGGAEIDLEWDSQTGLRIAGGVGIGVLIPGPIQLGPVALFDLSVQLGVHVDRGITLESRTGISADLSIMQFSVADIGFDVAVELGDPDADVPGPPFGLAAAFKPPAGVGLGIGIGPVKGGGYIAAYPDEGRYEAVIELQVVKVGIAAFVLIDTQALGDDGGWSMFFALFITLPSIQLGYGFTLEGVGGVAGVNRTMDPDAMLAAARSGQIDGVLFPEDPIADAPMIIDAFRTFFPPAADRYVFGPVVQIGWGGVITGQLGIIIELPSPIVIAILGGLRVSLPDPDFAAIHLQMDVVGIIDFGAGTIAMDAALNDSHIAGFPLTGGMSLRAGFKGQPGFLLAIGGFHPGFNPPGDFPDTPRVGMEIRIAGIIVITVEGYVAITSQTLQFGAAMQLCADLEVFSIEGTFSFNTLIHFNPFSLVADLDVYVAVRLGGLELLTVLVTGTLVGPDPWVVSGVATFRALGSEQVIELNHATGEEELPPPPPIPDVLGLLVDGLNAEDAWQVVDGGSVGVELADVPVAPNTPPPPPRIAPDSGITVTQRVVPLDTDITTFESQVDLTHHRFELSASIPGLGTPVPAEDWFAPATFVQPEGGEAALLAAPSFEQMPAGLRFPRSVAAGPSRRAELGHKVVTIDQLVSPTGDPRGADAPEVTVVVDEAGGVAGAPRPGGRPLTSVSGVDRVALAASRVVPVDPKTGRQGQAVRPSAMTTGRAARPWELTAR